MAAIKLEASWRAQLASELKQDYMASLYQFLDAEKNAAKVIYPDESLWFGALDSTPFDKVKVVILGQDPYHGPNQAHGLCFSVMPGVPVPPSLVNIYKELELDFGIAPANHGYLQAWADQGVLLLNSVLTVEQAKAGAHQGKGWEKFTDAVIAAINEQREGVVFLLWGAYAHKKGAMIDRDKHLVLQSPHPSPLSAHRGFYGNQHFSRTNSYLATKGLSPIEWQLPEDVM